MAGPTRNLQEALSGQLTARQQDGLYRQRILIDSAQGPEVQVGGRPMLAFCSNDYLGLAAHPAVQEAFIEGAREYGVGAGASHLVCGHMRPHHRLEQALAAFTGRPRALLFSSGYLANIGVITSLLRRKDTVYEDRLNHASLIDGALLSRARLHRYAHADDSALASMLASAGPGRRLVVTDGVFSMDGDVAPLARLAACCAEHQAWLMVDDAHGLGVLGPGGRGSLAASALGCDEVPVLMGTLGKAFGVAGAFVAGSEELIENLVQRARSYIYTTALPPAAASACLAALELVERGDELRRHLGSLVTQFRAGAAAIGLDMMPSSTAIQPLLLGDAETALKWSSGLRERGLLVTAIRPPTVPDGTSRLRITFTAAHQAAQVDRLLEALEDMSRV